MAVKRNIRAYELLFAIESVLRELLIDHCERAFGSYWWRDSVLSHSARKRLSDAITLGVERRRKDDAKTWTSRRVFHPLYFVEFADLAEAFRMNANASLDALCIANERREVSDQLFRLLPIRNAVAHMRLISTADLLQIEAAHDILAGIVGRDEFARLSDTLPSQCLVRQEMDSAAECLSAALVSVSTVGAVDLTAWTKIASRWWLDIEWHVDSVSIRHGADLCVAYRDEYERDLVGRRGRMERWIRQNWRREVVERAIASLKREHPDD